MPRRELMPFGTVSLTTYFHVDAEELAAEDITRVLAVADAKIFHKSYGDQNGELWSPNGAAARDHDADRVFQGVGNQRVGACREGKAQRAHHESNALDEWWARAALLPTLRYIEGCLHA